MGKTNPPIHICTGATEIELVVAGTVA